MKITIPDDPRDVPPQREIEDVLLVICQKAGLRPDSLSFSVIGGRNEHKFRQQGVKLTSMEHNAQTVPLLVGCERKTVEGYLTSSDIPKAAELHSKLIGAFGNNRVHLVDSRRIRGARSFFSAQAQPAPPPVQKNGNGSHEVIEFSAPPPLVPPTADVPQGEVMETDPRSLINNPKMVHLALIAFATNFKVNEPFGFAKFGQVLEDIGIMLKFPGPYVRVFTDSGFLIRLNPGRAPSRYAVTELGYTIAMAADTEAVTLIVEHLKKPEKEGNAEEDSGGTVLDRIQTLRESEEKFQALQRQIEGRAQELSKLRARDLPKEEHDIQAQIRSLEDRLKTLQEALERLGTDRNRIRTLGEEIDNLKKSASALTKAHEEFLQIKKMMGG